MVLSGREETGGERNLNIKARMSNDLTWGDGSISPDMRKKPKKKLSGTVSKIIKPPHPSMPEKAQIEVHEGEDLYKEIRVENKLEDEKGKEVRLKEGADVELTVEAEPEATTEVPMKQKRDEGTKLQ
jgi:hypothetical protein